jgi:hypothetical protein
MLNASVRPLPCVSEKNAWQRHYCAFLVFCRVLETHGKQPVSRSETLLVPVVSLPSMLVLI